MNSDLLWKSVDKAVIEDYSNFLKAVNERSEFKAGLRSEYIAPNDALAESVEYFHYNICYDDRMKYICDNFVLNENISSNNRILNIIISHFYGARGIHSVLTNISDPKLAIVNFDKLAEEQLSGILDYTIMMRENAVLAKSLNKPFWGTTELHTSIMAEGNKFVKKMYGIQGTQFNVCEWLASWINNSLIERIRNVHSFRELYDVFIEQRNVGEYYAYHAAASGSNNKELKAYHDEPFCSPGPGARMTAALMFPTVSKKEVSFADRVIWIRNNQFELMDVPEIHPTKWNYFDIYPEPQNKLTVYGNEVGMCQYSVYCRLRDNPHLIKYRKVARVETEESPFDKFFE